MRKAKGIYNSPINSLNKRIIHLQPDLFRPGFGLAPAVDLGDDVFAEMSIRQHMHITFQYSFCFSHRCNEGDEIHDLLPNQPRTTQLHIELPPLLQLPPPLPIQRLPQLLTSKRKGSVAKDLVEGFLVVVVAVGGGVVDCSDVDDDVEGVDYVISSRMSVLRSVAILQECYDGKIIGKNGERTNLLIPRPSQLRILKLRRPPQQRDTQRFVRVEGAGVGSHRLLPYRFVSCSVE